MVIANTWGADYYRDRDEDFPDCRFCRGPEAAPNRERWGCDATAEKPVFTISCECGGDPECELDECEEGRLYQYRCPNMLLRESGRMPEINQFMEAYFGYSERHILPDPGGLNDQSASFLAACRVADAERSSWDRERREWMDEKRRVADSKSKRGKVPLSG